MKRHSSLATLTTVRTVALSLVLLSLLLLAPSARFSSSAVSVVPTLGAPKTSEKLSPTVAQAAGFAESSAVRDLEPVKLSAAEAQRLKGLSEDRKLNELNEVPLKQ